MEVGYAIKTRACEVHVVVVDIVYYGSCSTQMWMHYSEAQACGAGVIYNKSKFVDNWK